MSPGTTGLDPNRLPVAATVPSSCLLDIYRRTQEVERTTGMDVVKLHVGDPYFDPPAAVANAVHEAIRRGDTKYTTVEGIAPLREALVQKLATENHLDTTVDKVFVSPGSAQGLTALLRTIVEPGAEILLPELHWPVHLQQSLFAGFRPVFYSLGPGFRPTPEAVAAAATPRTRVLLLNSPANPTGVVLDRGTLGALLDLARRQGWQVISDEAYEHYVYDGEHFSVASLERDLPDHERIVHSTFSFSKSAAMTGYRLGYVVTADERTASAMRVVQEAGIIAPSTPVQYAGIAALRSPDAIAANAAVVGRNRDELLPLRDAGLLDELPAGGWYALLDVSPTGLDAEAFTARLLQAQGVAVVPAAGFALRPTLAPGGQVLSVDYAPWARSLVRVAFCGDPKLVRLGVDRILDFVRQCGAE